MEIEKTASLLKTQRFSFYHAVYHLVNLSLPVVISQFLNVMMKLISLFYIGNIDNYRFAGMGLGNS